MTTEAAQELGIPAQPHHQFIQGLLPQLELVETHSAPLIGAVISPCSLPETGNEGVAAVIKAVADTASTEFRKINGILHAGERTTRERNLLLATTMALFNKLGMLQSDETSLEQFVQQYHQAQAAQESLTALQRAELMDTYEADPAHRAVDELGSHMGQSDMNVVQLRRTVLVLLDASQIPPTKLTS